jgi:mannose-6-phosphate isomerase class I
MTPAAGMVKIANSIEPIIFRARLNPVLRFYAWGGFDLARWLKRPAQKIAEIWFCSTQADGVSFFNGMSFARAVEANPRAMLGSHFTSKPTFSKVLGKDQNQPQIVQIGFKEKIVGREQDFIDAMERERLLVVQLKDELNRILALVRDAVKRQETFDEYRLAYEDWVSEESAVGWTLGHGPKFNGAKIAEVIQGYGFDVTVFGRLTDVRRELAGYLHTIELKPGQTIIAPVGYIHSIVGSHQTHPLVNEAKNEAWYIFSPGKNDAGKDVLFYFEPQQTSNTTYSLFDFPTPIVFADGRAEMRKDLTKGLGAILIAGEEPPETDEAAIRLIAERTVRFEPAKPEDFIVNAKTRNVSTEYRAVAARVERAVGGSYRVIENAPFVLDTITLNGSVKTPAEVTVTPLDGSYSDIVVLEGEVTITIDGKRETLAAGDAIFFPASDAVPRTIETSADARLARSYPPQEIAVPEAASGEWLKKYAAEPSVQELVATMETIAEMVGEAVDMVVILAYDTGMAQRDAGTDDGSLLTSRLVESVLNKHLGDVGKNLVVTLNGSGAGLAHQIEAERSRLERQGKKVRSVVAIAGSATVQQNGDALQKLGTVLSVHSAPGFYNAIPDLYDLALRIAYERLDVIDCLRRISVPPAADDEGSDLLRPLTGGIIRVLPKIRPVNLEAEREAQQTVQHALRSLNGPREG